MPSAINWEETLSTLKARSRLTVHFFHENDLKSNKSNEIVENLADISCRQTKTTAKSRTNISSILKKKNKFQITTVARLGNFFNSKENMICGRKNFLVPVKTRTKSVLLLNKILDSVDSGDSIIDKNCDQVNYCENCLSKKKDIMSRLASKECLLAPFEGVDKKKPFTRPFHKSRLEPNGSSTVRMTSPAPSETTSLLRQNQELRNRLHDEASNYRKRLDTYKQAQQNQAALVSRLQSKVLQYKQKCSEMEVQMTDNPVSSYKDVCGSLTQIPPLPGQHPAPLSLPCQSTEHSQSLRDYRDDADGACRRLDEERHRCEQLLAQNHLLRRQLEESHRTNESLTNDLQKLTNDWEGLRDEMMSKEDEWKEEEQAFNEYYHNEHNRLIRMWRDVVSVKRLFKDMQTAIKSDMGKMRCEITGVHREVTGACSGVSVNLKHAFKMEEAHAQQAERETMDVKQQVHSFKVQFESAKNEINQKEQRMQQMLMDLKSLEERCMQAENQASQAQRFNDEIERLSGALRDIAHAVVEDAECSEPETSAQHLHLSQGIIPPRSPKRVPIRTSQAFAEGTISAVQAALHKYQLLIHDLQVKLQSNSEALHVTKKQLDSSEHARDVLTTKCTEITDKLDVTNYQLSEILKERDSLQKNLESARNDNHTLERNKSEINAIVDNLNSDYEKLQNCNNKLHKISDSLEDEKKYVEMELQRVLKDKDILEMNLRAEEERTSRFREETITLREELNKMYLKGDLLDQQRLETDGLLSMVEKQRVDLEIDLEKTNLEKSEICDHLDKLNLANDTLTHDLKQMKAQLSQVEDERNKMRSQSSDQGVDLASLKKELIAAEQAKLDLDSEKLCLSEKLKFLELEKEKIEQELGQVSRERSELSNQLTVVTRKKDQLGEELMRCRQRLEQTNETNNRLNRNLEELVKENEEKQILIEHLEKDFQRCQEQLASIRSEKESLEAVLFDTNTTLEATEIKKDQMEREAQELLIKQESLKNHVARLNKDLENSERRAQEMKIQLTNAAANQEADFLQKIANLKQFGEENIKKLLEEKEAVRLSLEKRMQQSLQALEGAKDSEIEGLKERYENLQSHLEAVCQQHEEICIRAENDKQQSLMIAHRDKQAVMEKLEGVSRDLNSEVETTERLRREMAAKTEKDRAAMSQLREELARQKVKMEESRQRSEEDVKKMEAYMSSVRAERDAGMKDIEELKVQLRLSEDRGDSLNLQLLETLRKLKETENCMETVRKELTDTRRTLADSNIERDKYSASNKELRDHVKQVELARRDQGRTLEDSLSKIASLEESKKSLEIERTRLITVLKETENNLNRTSQELTAARAEIEKLQSSGSQKDVFEKELQARLNNESEERERVCQELHQVKKQLSDLDANLCATRQELGRARCKSNQDEHMFHTREQELIGRIEEGRCREKRLEDQKHNLEVCLADATQQIQELKARLGGAEGRVKALEDQLVHIESCKKETEFKLSSIGHTLRRIAGVQLDGSVSLPYRLLSPSRRYSPARGASAGYDCHGDTRSTCGDHPIIDVDPEMVRKGVRTLMQQVAHVEREKDDFRSQLCTAKKQLQEASDLQQKSENKISKLQQTLRAVSEEKSNLDSKLKQKLSALQSVEENLRLKSEEANTLREKVTNLELALGTGQEERVQCEDRLEKCRQNSSRLETEKRQLQEELARCEGRASKLDLQRVSIEGDIQRLQMVLQEKDNNCRNLVERLDNQTRSAAQLEDRCVSLKTTVDQLKERLQASAIVETEIRGELHCLQKERSEQGHNVLAGQDKIKQVQKTLTNSENERRVLSERLEAANHTLNELRRGQQTAQDMVQRLQEQTAEHEVQKSALESQLRISKWSQENADQMGGKFDDELSRQLVATQKERSELRSKVDSLNDKIRSMETDKRNNASKFSGNVKFDRSEKSLFSDDVDSNRMEADNQNRRPGQYSLNNSSFSCGLDHSQIEQEGRELRMKLRRLETLLAEKEAELARAKTKIIDSIKTMPGDSGSDSRYRSVQAQSERMLDAREQTHRQQTLRLENQITMLREQLAQEAKRRQMYIMRSSRAGKEMQQLRQTLGDSLRHVAHDPIDRDLLESEARRLDCAVSLSSLPPTSGRDYDRSLSPRMYK